MKLTFKRLSIPFGIAFSLISGITHAGQATVPNTFVAGTAAKAEEVNGNFDALKTEVNDNDTRITANAAAISDSAAVKQLVADDVNGTEIGILIAADNEYLFIRSTKGFLSKVRVPNGRIASNDAAYFTDVDCGNSGGVAYLDFLSELGGEGLIPGSVFDIVSPWGPYPIAISPEPWYLPKPATLLDNVAVQSVRKWDYNTSAVICTAAPVTLTTAALIFPNDPVVTGFPNVPFSAPITVEYR
jgi:hypothetical protein